MSNGIKAMKAAINALMLPCDRWDETQLSIVNDAIDGLIESVKEIENADETYCDRCKHQQNNLFKNFFKLKN